MTDQQLFAAIVPIVLTQITTIVVLIFGFISNNKRLDDIKNELAEIRKTLKEHGERITRLEERIPPLVHR